MMLDQININYSFNYWSEFFLESCFDESKTWSEKKSVLPNSFAHNGLDEEAMEALSAAAV